MPQELNYSCIRHYSLEYYFYRGQIGGAGGAILGFTTVVPTELILQQGSLDSSDLELTRSNTTATSALTSYVISHGY